MPKKCLIRSIAKNAGKWLLNSFAKNARKNGRLILSVKILKQCSIPSIGKNDEKIGVRLPSLKILEK